MKFDAPDPIAEQACLLDITLAFCKLLHTCVYQVVYVPGVQACIGDLSAWSAVCLLQGSYRGRGLH